MKILLSDFDGTLCLHETGRSWYRQEDIEAIREFQKAGNLFGVCTGRPVRWLMRDMHPEIHPDLVVGSSGAHITDLKNDQVLFEKNMPEYLVKELMSTIDDCLLFSVQAGGDIYYLYDEKHPEPKLTCIMDIPRDHITGISICAGTPENAAVMAEMINRKMGEHLAAYQNIDYLDIIPAGSSKGTGTKLVKDVFGSELTAGIGDSFNDIPMMDAADLAFTFPASEMEVKEHADHIVESIAEAIEIMNRQ